MLNITILSKALPIFLLFAMGFYMRKTHFLSASTVEELKRLIINLSLPSLLFLSFSKTSFDIGHLAIVVTVFGVCLFMLFIGLFIRKIFGVRSVYFPLLLTGFEAGMMGYSFFSILYGSENIFKFAIIDLGQVTFVFFILVTILVKYRDRNTDFSKVLLSFIKTPVILAIVLGIIVQKTDLTDTFASFPLTASVLDTLTLIATLTTPLISMVIGYEIIIEASSTGRVLKVIIFRMAVLFTIALVINKVIISDLLHLDRTFQSALLMMFLLPPPFIIPLYLKSGDEENRKYVIQTLSIHTMITIIALMIVEMF